MRVLMDLSRLFLAARANRVVLNYEEILPRLAAPFPGRAANPSFHGFTTADPKNDRQTRFLLTLTGMGVQVHAHPYSPAPNFSIELALLARTGEGGVVLVSDDPELVRLLPWLHGPVRIAWMAAGLPVGWTPHILSGRVEFLDLTGITRY